MNTPDVLLNVFVVNDESVLLSFRKDLSEIQQPFQETAGESLGGFYFAGREKRTLFKNDIDQAHVEFPPGWRPLEFDEKKRADRLMPIPFVRDFRG